VIETPHRRRAALVAALAMLLALWLRQAADAAPRPQPDTLPPLNHSLEIEYWLD
jgi:hypothetical protein